jgi:hypothetical protein
VLFLLASSTLADDAHYKSVVVIFRIGADGVVTMTEQADIEVSPKSDLIERSYGLNDEQVVTVRRITKADGTPVKFETPWASKVAWHGTSGSYVIESTIDDALIPAWSIPRANELTRDEARSVSDPRERLRAALPIWREAWKHWRTRYLLDFQYEMPPPSEQGTDIQLQLYWPDGWTPVHEITGDTIGRKLPFNTYDSVRWRVQHLFDTNAKIDVRKHEIRAAAIAGFPAVCLLLWLLFVLRELWWRRGGGSGDSLDVDDRVLRETLYNEPPEVIAARWSGRVRPPRIESFLRRLEHDHKLGLTIEDQKVSMRLLVSREQLTPYERPVIDVLIPEGFEATSEQIRERDVDPADVISAQLTKIAAEANGPAKSPWYSQLTSFAIFVAGIALLVMNLKQAPQQPLLIFAALVGSSVLLAFWPDGMTRILLQSTLGAVIIPLIPIAIATAAVLAVNLAPQSPPGMYGAVGFSLVMLSVVKASLASSATRAPRASMQRRAELARVRKWLREQAHPPENAAPYFEALGLPARGGVKRIEQDEDWGDSLVA